MVKHDAANSCDGYLRQGNSLKPPRRQLSFYFSEYVCDAFSGLNAATFNKKPQRLK
jgi:hypothetical protein